MGVEDCLAENIKQNKVKLLKMLTTKNQVGRVLEESEQEWPLEGRRQYHALSRCFCQMQISDGSMNQIHRGWIANEVFRRVHPEGSTIGDAESTSLQSHNFMQESFFAQKFLSLWTPKPSSAFARPS